MKWLTRLRRRWFAQLYDRTMARYEEHLAERKGAFLSGIEGSILEIGAGTGASLTHLRDRHWVGTDPNPFMAERLKARLEGSECNGSVLVLSGEALGFAEGSFDSVLSTLVLCSVKSPSSMLSEIHRVLKPGGKFYFIEHVAAPKRTWCRRAQRVMRPLWMSFADGCRPDRETEPLIRDAGFCEIEIESFRVPSPIVPPFISPHLQGWARK